MCMSLKQAGPEKKTTTRKVANKAPDWKNTMVLLITGDQITDSKRHLKKVPSFRIPTITSLLSTAHNIIPGFVEFEET